MMGIEADDVELGRDVTLGSAKLRKVDEYYRFFGAHAEASDRASEATIPAQSHGQSDWVDVAWPTMASALGCGFQLSQGEGTGRPVCLDDRRRSDRLGSQTRQLVREPLSPDHAEATRHGQHRLSTNGARRAGVHRSHRGSHKGLWRLAVNLGESGALEGQLYADPNGWSTDNEVVQPWRVTIVARNLTDLVNTTLVENLNPPASAQLTKADWINPGRSAWQWLASGDPKESEQQQWIDWTSQLGFEYYLIDEGWERWPDSWQAIPSDVAYAKTKNVKIWIWTHSRSVWDPEQRKGILPESG